MSVARFIAKHLGLREELGKLEAVEGLISRRRMLLGASLLGGALATPRTARAAPPVSHTRWLVNRLTFGWTPEEQLLADTLGFYGYLEYHLNPGAIDDAEMPQILSSYETLDMLPYQSVTIPFGGYMDMQLQEATMLRAAFSKRQLFERLVEFWSDHFTTYIHTMSGSWMKPTEDRAIRTAAMTSFAQLLNASAHSSAMLHYLGNDASIATSPNENYARELMELHTLGVNGGYTFDDIRNVARCFTGWTYYPIAPFEHNVYLFRFNPDLHDSGPKTVLGQSIPAGGGESDGLAVLNILANHPSTAQFVSKKLCKRFYADNPPQSLVDAVAATFTATGGDVKSMVRTLFTVGDPAQSTPRIKRPFHYFASCVRATRPQLTGDGQNISQDMFNLLNNAGHVPFEWPAPDGYPDTVGAWSSAILPRWNIAAALAVGDVRGFSVNIDNFLGGATTPDEILDVFNNRIYGGLMDPQDREDIRTFILSNPVTTSLTQREALGLALSTPAMQWF